MQMQPAAVQHGTARHGTPRTPEPRFQQGKPSLPNPTASQPETHFASQSLKGGGRLLSPPKQCTPRSRGYLGQEGPPFFWLEKAQLHPSPAERLGGGWKLHGESCRAGGRSWGLLGLTLQNQNRFQTARGRRKAQGLGEKLAARAGWEVTGSHLEHPARHREDLST